MVDRGEITTGVNQMRISECGMWIAEWGMRIAEEKYEKDLGMNRLRNVLNADFGMRNIPISDCRMRISESKIHILKRTAKK